MSGVDAENTYSIASLRKFRGTREILSKFIGEIQFMFALNIEIFLLHAALNIDNQLISDLNRRSQKIKI